MYGENKKDLVEIIKKLCEMKQVDLIDGRACKDHIHMYVAISSKMSVSEFMSYLKGKSTLMLFDRHSEYRTKWGDPSRTRNDCAVRQKGRSGQAHSLRHDGQLLKAVQT